MTTLYLIRGVPGSGKSTFAESLLSSGMVDFVYEADHYFYEDGEYKFDASKLGRSHKQCQDSVRSALISGRSVAVSNTSTTEREVHVYKEIAEEFAAHFVSVVVENRHEGVNVHNVPEDKIRQMKDRFSIKL
jgi:predicted kinase